VKEKWQTIINTSPDGIAIISMDGFIQFASGKLLVMHGYQKQEEVGGSAHF